MYAKYFAVPPLGNEPFDRASWPLLSTHIRVRSYLCIFYTIPDMSCSYLIASMGLQLLWSFGLGCLDMYALRIKRDLHNPVLVSLFVVGDWVCTSALLCHLAYVM